MFSLVVSYKEIKFSYDVISTISTRVYMLIFISTISTKAQRVISKWTLILVLYAQKGSFGRLLWNGGSIMNLV